MLGDRLKEMRIKRGLTQPDLSRATGISKATISNYELGRSTPDMRSLALLMDALDVDANYIMQDEIAEYTKIKTGMTSDEALLLRTYRSLDYFGKRLVNLVANEEAMRVNSDPIAGKEADYEDVREKALAAQRKRISESDPAKAE
jgi:repressor LexA|nr:MAG TPA: Repressor protein CI [Caudoviricetes sp.]